MDVCADPGPAEFVTRAWEYLQRHPVANNLVCTVAQARARAAVRAPEGGYWLRATVDGQVTGAAIVTTPGSGAILSVSSAEAARALADYLTGRQPRLTSVIGPEAETRAFAERYSEKSGTGARPGMAMAAFRLDAVTHPSGVPGAARPATVDDLDLIVAWQRAFVAEALPDEPPSDPSGMIRRRLEDPEAMWFWLVDGEPVSFALRARVRPVPGQESVELARIGGVYTPAEHRGHGYASANVAALSQYCLDSGCSAVMLHTDVANPTSNKIYQQLGYRPAGTARTWLLGRPAS